MALSVVDWISAAGTIVSTVVAIVAVMIGYFGALQVTSQKQIYRLGMSQKSLGPWRSTVVHPAKLGFQRIITTPYINVAALAKNDWKPKLAFPAGFRLPMSETDLEVGADHSDLILAETSWVNFLEALSISPTQSSLYQMRFQSDLVNGIVPMRWRGKDLVSICTVLGFQSYEDTPHSKAPMPLPMQWSGPIGWLQFRASFDGCIVEYRRRAAVQPQLSEDVRSYFNKLNVPPRPLSIARRLWQSMSGFSLKGNRKLYVGGGYRSKSDNKKSKLEVMSKCRGLLSICHAGETADSRGLDCRNCYEYDRKYVDEDEWKAATHPYRVGNLCLNRELLELFKEAVMEIKPDGFFFTPQKNLFLDLREWNSHVHHHSEEAAEFFPTSKQEHWAENGKNWITLYHAMVLCNEFQRIKKTSRADFTTKDMRIVSKATEALRQVSGDGIDLVWAFMIAPPFFSKMAERYGKMDVEDVPVHFHVRSADETIFLVDSKDHTAEGEQFTAPLMRAGEFSGEQVFAAFIDVLLTYFWIEKKWVSDVGAYDSTIPQSVTMC